MLAATAVASSSSCIRFSDICRPSTRAFDWRPAHRRGWNSLLLCSLIIMDHSSRELGLRIRIRKWKQLSCSCFHSNAHLMRCYATCFLPPTRLPVETEACGLSRATLSSRQVKHTQPLGCEARAGGFRLQAFGCNSSTWSCKWKPRYKVSSDRPNCSLQTNLKLQTQSQTQTHTQKSRLRLRRRLKLKP